MLWDGVSSHDSSNFISEVKKVLGKVTSILARNP
jgi:hypothetical protein